MTIKKAPGSFRDPSGFVWEEEGKIYRTITEFYRPHWEKAEPFLKQMIKEDLIQPFEETTPFTGTWKTIEVKRLPFISYPYEWSYDQLKDAALLTLKLQRKALKKGLILKDASVYNIQFDGAKPVFIDHLSFEVWQEGNPWGAYRQFCSHFLAPLALMSGVDLRCGLMMRLFIDGIPLDMASTMLPMKKKMNPGIHFHIVTHAKMQDKYSDTKKAEGKTKSVKITKDYLINLAAQLERMIKDKAFQLPEVETVWGNYYENTNYTEAAEEEKFKMVKELAQKFRGTGIAVDLGANNGRYTRAIAPFFQYALAVDMDPLAVNQNYKMLKRDKETNILPLLIDLSNPSPGIGFNNLERPEFKERCKGDFVIALALIHHLRVTAGIPLSLIAEFFASMINEGGVLVLEFVPKEDSQMEKLLAMREDVFYDYSLEGCKEAFQPWFDCEEIRAIKESKRHILVLKKMK